MVSTNKLAQITYVLVELEKFLDNSLDYYMEDTSDLFLLAPDNAFTSWNEVEKVAKQVTDKRAISNEKIKQRQ